MTSQAKEQAPLRRVTIFGGSGFIGRHLVERLGGAGIDVRIGARREGGDDASRTRPGRVDRIKADLLEDQSIGAAIADADAVVNLVGILHESGRQRFAAIHEEGARRVAWAARKAGVRRLVHISALGASRTSPAAYARTKAAGEDAVREIFPQATILRPSIVFGPEDSFFNRFAAMTRISPALPLIGGGRTRFQPVHVDDVADAIAVVLADGKTAGKIYELGGPRIYSFRELMELLLAQLGRRRLLVPIPFSVAEVQGMVLQLLPHPPLTRDQVQLLRTDNVVSGKCPGFAELGIQPNPIEDVLPTYLGR